MNHRKIDICDDNLSGFGRFAARVMAGESLASFGLKPKVLKHVGVKEAVFPFARFPGVDVLLGPEMRSTGEVIGLDRSFDVAFAKSQLGAGSKVPTSGTVFISVRDADKPRIYRQRVRAVFDRRGDVVRRVGRHRGLGLDRDGLDGDRAAGRHRSRDHDHTPGQRCVVRPGSVGHRVVQLRRLAIKYVKK
jgi:hypothetical protein